MRIGLTSIPVHNPLEAFTFYTQVLGFKEKLYLPEMNLAIVVSPEEPEGTGLLLEPNENPLSKSYQEGLFQAGIPVMVFTTDDIARDYKHLKAKGVIFRKEPTKADWGTETLLEDTCGNLVQLAQMA